MMTMDYVGRAIPGTKCTSALTPELFKVIRNQGIQRWERDLTLYLTTTKKVSHALSCIHSLTKIYTFHIVTSGVQRYSPTRLFPPLLLSHRDP
jgi:hypothetical protein